MRLEEINPDTRVFIDSNIFIYHFTGASEESSNFLARCEEGTLSGFTSVNVLLEILHRMMMVEAVKKNLIKPPGIIQKLKKKPEKVCELNDYYVNTLAIMDMGIQIYSIDPQLLKRSQVIRSQYGLLVNDSLIVALMQEEGIQILATNDDHFSRVDWIKIHKPGDLI